jgi:hypothetical protein
MPRAARRRRCRAASCFHPRWGFEPPLAVRHERCRATSVAGPTGGCRQPYAIHCSEHSIPDGVSSRLWLLGERVAKQLVRSS